MPLAEEIDYRQAAVIFNVTNTTGWLPKRMQWTLSTEGHAENPNDAQWWLPDADVRDAIISVQRSGLILFFLSLSPCLLCSCALSLCTFIPVRLYAMHLLVQSL